MRFIFTILAVLFSFSANAQTFPGFMPADTIKCNNTAAETLEANCLFITTAITTKWFLNDVPPAAISNFGDRVFIGDAIKYVATTPTGGASGNDWYSQFTCGIYALCSAQIGNSVLVVETSLTNRFGTNAITGAASTLPCLGFNCGAIGVNAIGVNNVAATAGRTYKVWGLYAECNNVVNNTGVCITAELDLANYFNTGHTVAPNPFSAGVNVVIQSTCGVSPSPQFDCDAWNQLPDNGGAGGPRFLTGINIGFDRIKVAAGPVMGATGINATVAIALAEAQDIVWYHNSTTINAAIFAGGSGNLNLVGNNLVINGIAAVSCGPGFPTPVFTVTNGIVTTC